MPRAGPHGRMRGSCERQKSRINFASARSSRFNCGCRMGEPMRFAIRRCSWFRGPSLRWRSINPAFESPRGSFSVIPSTSSASSRSVTAAPGREQHPTADRAQRTWGITGHEKTATPWTFGGPSRRRANSRSLSPCGTRRSWRRIFRGRACFARQGIPYRIASGTGRPTRLGWLFLRSG